MYKYIYNMYIVIYIYNMYMYKQLPKTYRMQSETADY